MAIRGHRPRLAPIAVDVEAGLVAAVGVAERHEQLGADLAPAGSASRSLLYAAVKLMTRIALGASVTLLVVAYQR